MSKYVKVADECGFCGDLARRERHQDVPENWHDGTPIKAKYRRGSIICADCQWFEFDDFCQSQGCSAANPVRYYP